MLGSIGKIISNISSSAKKIGIEKSEESYKDANYYNFYRILEKQPEELSRRKCGLYQASAPASSSNCFKLTSFNIEAEINDSCSTSVMIQEYTNDSSTPVEAKYQIPLHTNSVISNFQIEYQDKVLQGKIKEKSKAQEKYSDSIASGGQAFLAEKTENGYFNISIGNLPPKEKVTIRIVITSELGTHLGAYHYCLHRYMFPSTSFNFNLNVNVKLSVPIKSFESDDYYKPTITYKEGTDNKEATITTKTSIGGVKKSIILAIEPLDSLSNEPKSIVEYNEEAKSYAVAMNFQPNFKDIKLEDINQHAEFIFVIDCSGSMSGAPIEKAKRALEIIIRSLNEQHKINIYCFGSSFNKAFPSSRLYDDDSLDQVGAYVEKIDANLGGTCLLPPIQDILSSPVDLEYPRQVFILTDGEIDSRDQLIDYVAKEANTTRIFTYGIGSGVDQELVIGLSKACRGYYEFIKDNSDMEKQVMKLLNVAFEPMIANIKIDYSSITNSVADGSSENTTIDNSITVIQAPNKIRPIFNNERMIVYSSISSNEKLTGIRNVILTGDGPKGNKLSFPIKLNFDEIISSNTNTIHTLTAFRIIQDLEESERKERKDHKDQIVQLGKRYGLVSKHTSYIVTSESDGQVTEESMKSVNVTEQEPTANRYRLSLHSGGGRGGSAVGSTSMLRKGSSPPTSSSNISRSSQIHLSPSPAPLVSNRLSNSTAQKDCKEKSKKKCEKSDKGSHSISKKMIDFDQEEEKEQEEIKVNSNTEGGDGHGDDDDELSSQSSESLDEVNEVCKTLDSLPIELEAQELQCKQVKISSPRKLSPSTTTSTTSTSAPTPSKSSPVLASRPGAPPSPVQKPTMAPSRPKVTTGDLLIDLLKAQKANGSWTKDSTSNFNISIDKVPTELSAPELNDIWITLLVIAKITKIFTNEKSQWELATNKSIKWVKLQLTKLNLDDLTFDKFLSTAKDSVNKTTNVF